VFQRCFKSLDFKNPTENAIVMWGIASANLPSDRQFHFLVYHYVNTDMNGLSESHQFRSVLILRRIYLKKILLIMTGTILVYLDVKCRSVVCAF